MRRTDDQRKAMFARLRGERAQLSPAIQQRQRERGQQYSREEQKKKDREILNQLLTGNHLEPEELERARQLIHSLDVEMRNRVNNDA